MAGKMFISRLSLEQRIARAVGFVITVRRCPAEVYRKTAATLAEARLIVPRMNADRAEGEPPAIIAAVTPEGKTFAVPDTAPDRP